MKAKAIVPMREYSERVPGKNYRLFNGKPLFFHILETLSDTDLISEIIISTDSHYISDETSKHFPHITVSPRPEHLRDPMISMNEILLELSSRFHDDEIILQTHSTNPLLRSESIQAALQYFFENQTHIDSLFSVTRFHKRLWDATTTPINHNPAVLLRTQDLAPLFEENSCIYIFTVKSLQMHTNRIGSHPIMWELNKTEAFDIDDEYDFVTAEFLQKLDTQLRK